MARVPLSNSAPVVGGRGGGSQTHPLVKNGRRRVTLPPPPHTPGLINENQILYPPQCPAPPLLVHPPPGEGGRGGRHWLVPGKNVPVSYRIELRDCETSLSELMCTSFVLTHCTPQTSENVPSRPFCMSPGTSRSTSGSPKNWWPQQFLNPHPNVHVCHRQSQILIRPTTGN